MGYFFPIRPKLDQSMKNTSRPHSWFSITESVQWKRVLAGIVVIPSKNAIQIVIRTLSQSISIFMVDIQCREARPCTLYFDDAPHSYLFIWFNQINNTSKYMIIYQVLITRKEKRKAPTSYKIFIITPLGNVSNNNYPIFPICFN